MKNSQTELLISLAKELKQEKKSRTKVLKTFISAGILTKEGEFTENYQKLNAIFKLAPAK
jgi:hypothetical protein